MLVGFSEASPSSVTSRKSDWFCAKLCNGIIGRCYFFMKIRADWCERNHLQVVGTDDGQDLIALGECKQGDSVLPEPHV